MPSVAQTAPARLQFEVASVRPAAEQAFPAGMVEALRAQRPGLIPLDGDRVHFENMALLDLIAAAYHVRTSEILGPAWLSDDRYDVEARVPAGTAREDLNAMLQSLLEDRFGLKVHRAARSEEGYALVIGKDGPKLKQAAPPASASDTQLTVEERKAQMQQRLEASMKQMQERSAVVGAGFSTQSFNAMTMEDLAAYLVHSAGAPVVDATGLTGKYSVTIETWKNPEVPGGTIFDAVEKLGLKLEPRKVTVETLVVDQVSRAPTAN